MAHNFKIIGDSYISKSGHDSNDGTTPDTPTKTWKNSLPGATIIGAGQYIIDNIFANSNFLNLKADGKVIIKTLVGSILHTAENGHRFNSLTLEGYSGFRYAGSLAGQYFTNCIIKNWTQLGYLNAGTFCRGIGYTDCKIINTDAFMSNLNTGYDVVFNGCIFINSPLYSNAITSGTDRFKISNCYVDVDSYLMATKSNPGFFRNNNVNGLIKLDNIYYAIQDQLQGTPQDNGYAPGVFWLNEANLTLNSYPYTIAGWNTAVATCINRPPLFNNVSFEDFSLQAGSPHIGRSSAGLNIGSTNPAISIYNNNITTSQIIPSSEIDTTNPNSYVVKDGFTEGYIDYIEKVGSSALTLKEIDPVTSLEFDSDIQGGSIGNQNVPDSEPLTFEYPRKITTTSIAADALSLNVTSHDVTVGEFVRVAGEDREVISVTTDTITVDTAFRAIVGTGVEFQVGEKVRIGALNPNRLTFMMRTSKVDNPSLDSDWDNDIDPVYNKAGVFLTQEWGEIPGYYIDTSNNNVWGSGDSETPQGLTKNEISCKWIHIRVYIRNNYES